MSNPSIATLLKYANLQMAAEAILPVGFAGVVDAVELTDGNNRASKFTPTQANQFITDNWVVVAHQDNMPTGFSGTLFKYNGPSDPSRGLVNGELVLSFRSTEFIDDAVRDNEATNVLELREYGWAFGQIADMESWYASLKTSGVIPPSQQITVTGYSLGGHLATAFNLLHAGETTILGHPTIAGTYTFNGAGVGSVPNATLNQVMIQFAQQRNGAGLTFSNQAAADKYAQLRALYNGSAGAPLITDAAIQAVRTDPTLIAADAALFAFALQRAKQVADEKQRVSTIVNTGPGGRPASVAIDQIEAAQFDYQYAVVLAGQRTSSYRTIAVLGGWDAFQGRNPAPGSPLPNFYDLYGANSPSAVANSQYHYGRETPIFVEDQPLYRGSVILDGAGVGGEQLAVVSRGGTDCPSAPLRLAQQRQATLLLAAPVFGTPCSARNWKRACASNSANSCVAISSIRRFTPVPRRFDKAFSGSYLWLGLRVDRSSVRS